MSIISSAVNLGGRSVW